MIVKIYFPYIDLLIKNITGFVQFKHKASVIAYATGADISEVDLETTKLLMLCYNLRDIKRVEEAKREEASLRISYLQTRLEMMFEYLAVKHDSELESAIKSIQKEINGLTKSSQIYGAIDVEIDDNLHLILAQNNLLI